MGPSLFVIVEDGELRLGTWQSLYLYEGDGPRTRSVWLQWLPGSASPSGEGGPMGTGTERASGQ